jgi:nucleotide-binding universal stress UspA family protein
MYKIILVPLDGSARAEVILPHAEDLARRYRAKVIFLQVVEPEPLIVGPDVVYPVVNQEMMAERTQAAEAYLADRRAEFEARGIEVETRVAHGPVVEEIINRAERSQVDLIAMASHGRTGLSRVFYGSVAAGVLHKIDRPLFLIRSSGSS